jgi:hypothetical protein
MLAGGAVVLEAYAVAPLAFLVLVIVPEKGVVTASFGFGLELAIAVVGAGPPTTFQRRTPAAFTTASYMLPSTPRHLVPTSTSDDLIGGHFRALNSSCCLLLNWPDIPCLDYLIRYVFRTHNCS